MKILDSLYKVVRLRIVVVPAFLLVELPHFSTAIFAIYFFPGWTLLLLFLVALSFLITISNQP